MPSEEGILVSGLPISTNLNIRSLLMVADEDTTMSSGFGSRKASVEAVGNLICATMIFSALNSPTSSTIVSAINEALSQANLARAYDNTATYTVNDYVIYQTILYKCTTAVTIPEDFDSTKWTRVLITDVMGSGGGGGGGSSVSWTQLIGTGTKIAEVEIDGVTTDVYAPTSGGASYTDVMGTLVAGQTSITLQDSSILTTSTIDIYTDAFGVNPTAVVVSAGSVTLTFQAQSTDIGVKVGVS